MSGAKRWFRPLGALLVALMMFVASAASAATCTVTAVTDGDTLKVLCGKQHHRVRMAGIDSPERGQPYYREAKDAMKAILAERAPGGVVTLRRVAYDSKWRRVVGRIEVGTPPADVGLLMVQAGAAWAYTGRTTPDLVDAMLDARRRQAGLWKGGCAVEPSQWRKGVRSC